jgi:hypothetical protein
MAIVAVLIGLLVPAIQRIRERANQLMCRNNLKQLGLAALKHESAQKRLPPGNSALFVELLPYLEPRNLSDAVTAPGGTQAKENKVRIYACPTNERGSAPVVMTTLSENALVWAVTGRDLQRSCNWSSIPAPVMTYSPSPSRGCQCAPR